MPARSSLLRVALAFAVVIAQPVRAGEAALDSADDVASDRMVDSGRQSSDLRVRIVHSMGELVQRDRVIVQDEAIPVETLVEQAHGSTDPVVLSMMVDRCHGSMRKAGRCDAVDFARRWTVADTQNVLAWVALSGTLSALGDMPGAGAAFRRAGQASQWHEYEPELARSLAASMPPVNDAVARAALLVAIVSKSYVSVPYAHYQTINERCKDLALRESCGRILTVMARDAQSLTTLHVATNLATARDVLPDATLTAMRLRSDAMRWAAVLQADHPDYGPTDPEGAARTVRYLEAVLARGEIDTMQRVLERQRVGESEAASRYVATLNPDQLARRERGGGTANASRSPRPVSAGSTRSTAASP